MRTRPEGTQTPSAPPPKPKAKAHIWTHCGSVAKCGVERFRVWIEKLLDVRETLDLELLRLFLNDLPARTSHMRCHTHVGPFYPAASGGV